MYLINPNGEYPRHIGDLLLEHPDWVSGDELPEGWTEVAPGEIPTIDESKQLWFEIEPQEIDGVWTRQFSVRKLTAKEIAAIEIPDPDAPSAILEES